MPISTAAAGRRLPPSERRITVRDALAYAAGIGDTRESVFDDARGGGIAAPPSYCVSLEWPGVSNGRGSQLLGGEADELVRGVHASQDSHFHRQIRPGDSLTTKGLYAAVRATRAGALLTVRPARHHTPRHRDLGPRRARSAARPRRWRPAPSETPVRPVHGDGHSWHGNRRGARTGGHDERRRQAGRLPGVERGRRGSGEPGRRRRRLSLRHERRRR